MASQISAPAPSQARPAFWRHTLQRAFETQGDRLVLWLPVCLGTGVATYFSLHTEPPAWLGASGLAACVAAGAALHRRVLLRGLAVALALYSAGFAVAQLRTKSVGSPIIERTLGPILVEGRISAMESRPRGPRVILDQLAIPAIETPDLPERIRIRLRQSDPALRPGARIRTRVMLRPPPEPAAPGAFDFARQAYFARIGGVGFALGPPRVIEAADAGAALPSSWQDAWRLWWSSLRTDIARRTGAAVSGETGAVAAALLTGDRSGISEPTMEAMRVSGLAHLLAISGLHLGLAAGLLFFTIRACLAFIPALALRFPIKKWAAAGAILGAFAYMQMVGSTIPTQRAFVMITLALLAVMLDRNPFSLRLVAWAAVVILLLAPESLLSASFQLSFAAVIALVSCYEALSAGRPGLWRREGVWSRILLYLAFLTLSSIVANIATAPFAGFHFNRLPAYGLAANLVAVPITAFCIMPSGLLAFLLMPFGLEFLPLTVMGWGIDLVLAVARAVADLDGAAIPVKAMPVWGFALAVFGGLWLCLWRGAPRWTGLAAVLVGVISASWTVSPDVLVSGDGKLMAVKTANGGMAASSRRLKPFERQIWLRRAGLTTWQPWPDDGPQEAALLRCDALGCIYSAREAKVALLGDGRGLRDDCGRVEVLVSLEPLRRVPCPRPSLIIDRFDLWRGGAHAIWLDPKPRAESVNARRGERPWVRQRTPARSESREAGLEPPSTGASGRPGAPGP